MSKRVPKLRFRTAVHNPATLAQLSASQPAPGADRVASRPGNENREEQERERDPAGRFLRAGGAAGGGGAAEEPGAAGASDQGGHGGDDSGYAADSDGEGAPQQTRKKPKRSKSRAEKNQTRFDDLLYLRPSRTSALTTIVPSSRVHLERMLEQDKEGRLAMLAKAACPTCGECAHMRCYVKAFVPKSISVHVFTEIGFYDMDVYAHLCLSCFHESTPDAEAAACFAAQAKKSRNGSSWFALSLLERADQYLFHGSAFKARSRFLTLFGGEGGFVYLFRGRGGGGRWRVCVEPRSSLVMEGSHPPPSFPPFL